MQQTQRFIDTLRGLGCNEWTGGSHHRVYVPHDLAARALGLDVHYYGTGNVSSATLNGEKISNTKARVLLEDLDGVYYDVNTQDWSHNRPGARDSDLVRNVGAGLERIVDEVA